MESKRILRKPSSLPNLPNHHPDRTRNVRLKRCRVLGRVAGEAGGFDTDAEVVRAGLAMPRYMYRLLRQASRAQHSATDVGRRFIGHRAH
jgi:hypothetical protein